MTRTNSPPHPTMSLPKSITAVGKIFSADRRNPVDREVAARHIGYTGKSGASDKALAALTHFGLTDKVGKGSVRVSQLAMDILHPDPTDPHGKERALLEAGMKPQLYKELRAHFPDHVSEDTLRSYLLRIGFNSTSLPPAMSSYFETLRFLEQSKAFESAGKGGETGEESDGQGADDDHENGASTVFGGAKVGDLIQWEVGGALQMEKPMRVRMVSDDGQWVAVEGSETGIPMNQVIVEQPASNPPSSQPPIFKLADTSGAELKVEAGETEWMRNLVGKDTKVRLLVSGDMGPREIGKLIKLLKAQQAVLSDDDEDGDDGDA